MVSLFRYPKRRLKKLIREGEYVQAIELGNRMESKHSDDPDFLFIMGGIYVILEDVKKALPYFEKASQLNNNDIEILTLKTNVHLVLEQKNYNAQELLEELENL